MSNNWYSGGLTLKQIEENRREVFFIVVRSEIERMAKDDELLLSSDDWAYVNENKVKYIDKYSAVAAAKMIYDSLKTSKQ